MEERQKVQEKVYLIFGKLSYNEKNGNIPTLELKERVGVDGPEKVVGYLSPFRGCYFQISATYDGDGELAAYSDVSGNMSSCFKDCTRIQKEGIYRGMMYSTILKYLASEFGKNYHPSYKLMKEWVEGSPIEEFINKSIDWAEK